MNARFVAPVFIHAHPVPDWEIRAFRIRFFGYEPVANRHCVARIMATHTGTACEEFEYVSLSNGGMYMAPSIPEGFSLQWRDGEQAHTCSAAAAGIRTSLAALREMFDDTGDQQFIRALFRLEDYARQHPERKFILGGAA